MLAGPKSGPKSSSLSLGSNVKPVGRAARPRVLAAEGCLAGLGGVWPLFLKGAGCPWGFVSATAFVPVPTQPQIRGPPRP